MSFTSASKGWFVDLEQSRDEHRALKDHIFSQVLIDMDRFPGYEMHECRHLVLMLLCILGLGLPAVMKMDSVSLQAKSGQGPLGSRAGPPKSPAG